MIGIYGDIDKSKSVIAILKSLGGKIDQEFGVDIDGSEEGFVYYIDVNDGCIDCIHKDSKMLEDQQIHFIYTVDQFYEKYPFIPGDRIFVGMPPKDDIIKELKVTNDTILYSTVNGNRLYNVDELYTMYTTEVQPSLICEKPIITLQDIEYISKFIQCDHDKVDIDTVINIINTLKNLK